MNRLLTEQREKSQLNLKPQNSIQRKIGSFVKYTSDIPWPQLPGWTYRVLFYFYWTYGKSALFRNELEFREIHTVITCCFQTYLEAGCQLKKRTINTKSHPTWHEHLNSFLKLPGKTGRYVGMYGKVKFHLMGHLVLSNLPALIPSFLRREGSSRFRCSLNVVRRYFDGSSSADTRAVCWLMQAFANGWTKN